MKKGGLWCFLFACVLLFSYAATQSNFLLALIVFLVILAKLGGLVYVIYLLYRLCRKIVLFLIRHLGKKPIPTAQ